MPMRVLETLAPVDLPRSRAPARVARTAPVESVAEHEGSRRRQVVAGQRSRPPVAPRTPLQGELLGRPTTTPGAVQVYLTLDRLGDPLAAPRTSFVDLYA
jgi:hypothetical protein